MKAVIYARCSTDESKQDVEAQLKELRRYCEAYGWGYEEVSEGTAVVTRASSPSSGR